MFGGMRSESEKFLYPFRRSFHSWIDLPCIAYHINMRCTPAPSPATALASERGDCQTRVSWVNERLLDAHGLPAHGARGKTQTHYPNMPFSLLPHLLQPIISSWTPAFHNKMNIMHSQVRPFCRGERNFGTILHVKESRKSRADIPLTQSVRLMRLIIRPTDRCSNKRNKRRCPVACSSREGRRAR